MLVIVPTGQLAQVQKWDTKISGRDISLCSLVPNGHSGSALRRLVCAKELPWARFTSSGQAGARKETPQPSSNHLLQAKPQVSRPLELLRLPLRHQNTTKCQAVPGGRGPSSATLTPGPWKWSADCISVSSAWPDWATLLLSQAN